MTGSPVTSTPSDEDVKWRRRWRRPEGDNVKDRGRRVTITDVAREANVSIATVSRVMSGATTVNLAMTEQVRHAAQNLGYRPNAAAQGLANGQYHSIGVVVPDLSNRYFHEIIKATSIGATRDGYRMLMSDSQGDPEEELNICMEQLSQVDGLLLLSSRISVDGLRILAKQDAPVVLVNRIELGIDLPFVAVDNFSPMLQICQHLVSLGHRRAVYLAGSDASWQNRERWRAVQQAKILGLDAVAIQADSTIDGGHLAAEAAMKHNPTAIIAFNDLGAVGAIGRLREMGMRVPEDVSVTGFDDIEFARHCQPPLTTAKSPRLALGEQSWAMLSAGLRGQRLAQPPLLEAEVVYRQSTGPAPR